MSKIVFYEREDIKLKVIGNSHIGSKSYFNRIKANLTGTVLYELVSHRDQNYKPAEIHPYARFAKILGLTMQSDEIELQDGWIRSDLYWEDLVAIDPKLNKLDNSRIDTMVRTIEDVAKKKPIYKKIITYTIDVVMNIPNTFIGNTYSTVELRNKKVILDLVVSIGRGYKDISILYGLAHLKDLEKNILAMNFKKVKTFKLNWRED